MLGCFEWLILLGIIIIIARLDRLSGRGDLRRLWDWLHRVPRYSGKKLIGASLVVGLLFVFVATAVSISHSSATPSTDIPPAFLFCLAILLFFWGLAKLLWSMFQGVRREDCPPIDYLKAFLAERLSSEERTRLAAHLELCTACQHLVEKLSAAHHSWHDMIHKLREWRHPSEPALRKVMAKLKESDEEASGDQPAFAADLPLGFLTPTDKPGQLGRLERYEVLEEIGRGGMGVVLKAFDPSLHRVVAIKVLAPQLATSGVARKRFLREAKAAAAVCHDHIVTIHAVDEANGLPYLVMHYVAGMSLQQRIDKDGPLELAEILRIGMQTASGLAAAHAHGIVHRDIKPANILLEDGVQRVKITDFGLARAMDDASLTQSGFVAGSPLYMAPEQARGEALDHRADLFSLGSVLYTMCTGRPPFRAANTLAVLRRVSEDVPRPIRETNPEIPDWLAVVVDKLMAKEPGERYQSVGEVVEILGQHLAQLQHASWVPSPPIANAPPPVGLPTSVTICPSCGASLHVSESMVGDLVHCAACGKPFHVEDTSEVMRVARPMQWPLALNKPRKKRCRFWRALRRGVGIVAGCAILVLLLILLLWLGAPRQPIKRPMATRADAPSSGPPSGNDWGYALADLPSEAALFGTLDLRNVNSRSLGDAQTQSLLHLLVPDQLLADQLTPKNLGRIKLSRITLGYYEKSRNEEARAIVQLSGTALDGHKRIVAFLRSYADDSDIHIEELDKRLGANGPVCISGPELPFAVKIANDNQAFLAVALKKNAKASAHRKILDKVPSGTNFASGYHPPWVKLAVANIPSNACGFLLGEIPDRWRKLLSKSLKLRVCPRTFVLQLYRRNNGILADLTLSLDKAGMEDVLRADVDKWRRRALGNWHSKFPALRKEPQAMASLARTLKSMSWKGSDSGSVRIQARLDPANFKAVGTLLKRMFPPDEDD